MANLIGKRPLPLLPHPDHLRKQAKTRLAAMKAELPGARLADAQRLLAQEYGFASWSALQAEVTHRTNEPFGRRVRSRRLLVAFFGSAPSGHPDLPTEEDYPPLAFLHSGVTAQICLIVAVLLGVGVVCFALHRAGVPLQSDQGVGPSGTELLRKVI